jgi:hypothetical protein
MEDHNKLEQKNSSDLASEARDILQALKPKLNDPGQENQVSGWIAVLETWRKVWEKQQE